LTAKIKSYTVVSAYNSLLFWGERSGMGSMDNSNEGKTFVEFRRKGGRPSAVRGDGAPAEDFEFQWTNQRGSAKRPGVKVGLRGGIFSAARSWIDAGGGTSAEV